MPINNVKMDVDLFNFLNNYFCFDSNKILIKLIRFFAACLKFNFVREYLYFLLDCCDLFPISLSTLSS